jgi:hypothetical protein
VGAGKEWGELLMASEWYKCTVLVLSKANAAMLIQAAVMAEKAARDAQDAGNAAVGSSAGLSGFTVVPSVGSAVASGDTALQEFGDGGGGDLPGAPAEPVGNQDKPFQKPFNLATMTDAHGQPLNESQALDEHTSRLSRVYGVILNRDSTQKSAWEDMLEHYQRMTVSHLHGAEHLRTPPGKQPHDCTRSLHHARTHT